MRSFVNGKLIFYCTQTPNILLTSCSIHFGEWLTINTSSGPVLLLVGCVTWVAPVAAAAIKTELPGLSGWSLPLCCVPAAQISCLSTYALNKSCFLGIGGSEPFCLLVARRILWQGKWQGLVLNYNTMHNSDACPCGICFTSTHFQEFGREYQCYLQFTTGQTDVQRAGLAHHQVSLRASSKAGEITQLCWPPGYWAVVPAMWT